MGCTRRETTAAATTIVVFVVLAFVVTASSQAVAPVEPFGCAQQTTRFTQGGAPIAIPAAGTSLSSTSIAVAGAGAALTDIDVTTNVPHTFPGDIDMTLESPAGTVVTLTTDNGGTNENVFNGTTWDDDADPGTQVPYDIDENLVTEHTYADNVLASPLVPEESLGAFVGQNPNGLWTLTVSDDSTGDGGSLNPWSLDVTTLVSARPLQGTSISNVTPVPVSNGLPSVVTSQIQVAGAGSSLSDVNVTTGLTHTFPGEIDMTLTSPGGTVVTLTTDNGSTNDNVFNGTRWDDDADPGTQVPYATNENLVTEHTYANNTPVSALVPEESLGAFNGESPSGTWTLTVSDDTNGDGGALSQWSLGLSTSVPCATPPTISIADNVVAEGDSGSATGDLTVTLGAALGNPAVVDYTTADGTATQPDDYATSAGRLTFAPGETTKTINVPISGDAAVEPDEVVLVDLTPVSGAEVADGQALLTISNDDADPPPPPSAPDTAAPDTAITSGPPKKTKKKSATFTFSSTEGGSTFQCSLDDATPTACSSPTTVKARKGKHSFSIAATDTAGNKDASPATYSWKVKKKKKRRHHEGGGGQNRA